MQNYIFHISGTHCNSCKMLIEDVLSDDTTLVNSVVNLENETLSLQTEEDNPDTLLSKLNANLGPHGFTLSAIS